MAGLGRRTHYRKHLTDSVLNDFPEPQEDERLAKVVATRGGNQFDVLVAAPTPTAATATASTTINEEEKDDPGYALYLKNRKPQLAILPTKFRKLVWVKRNDYVIVQTGAGDHEHYQDADNNENSDTGEGQNDTGGIRYIITHILYKDQLKHLRSIGVWPTNDPEFATVPAEDENDVEVSQQQADTSAAATEAGDGIFYDTMYNDDSENDDEPNEYFVNTNRVAALSLQDDDEDDSSEDD